MTPPDAMSLTRQPHTECDEHHKNSFFSGKLDASVNPLTIPSVQCFSSTVIGLKPGIKTIAAVHSQCRRWVIFVTSTRSPRPRHVLFGPIASEPSHRSDSTRCAKERPVALQRMASLFSLSHVTDAGINALYLDRDWFDRTEESPRRLRPDTRTFERQ
jgi:hypothetical protein